MIHPGWWRFSISQPRPFRFPRTGLAAAIVLVATSPVARAQPAPIPRGFSNARPQLTSTLPVENTAFAKDEIRFRVSVSDPNGDRVDLMLLDVPSGLEFEPARNAETPLVRDVVWRIHPSTRGLRELRFVARDRGTPPRAAELTLRFQLYGERGYESVHAGDVTGDGILDLVVQATSADWNGLHSSGALVVHPGGATVAVPGGAAPEPRRSSILFAPRANVSDSLPYFSHSEGLQLADVTGDGHLDIVAGVSLESVGSATRVGVVHVWKGGSSFDETAAPSATLVPTPQPYLHLGDVGTIGQSLLISDVTGDGILDVVAGTCRYDEGAATDVGAVFVWAGAGALSGDVAPRAVLTVPGAAANDKLGWNQGQGIQLGDLNGDGTTDVIAAASRADVAGIADTGALYAWFGGPGLAGQLAPSATLAIPGASSFSLLAEGGHGFDLVDVSADGVLDVVAKAPLLSVGGTARAGAIAIWFGGASLGSLPPPSSMLTIPGASPHDALGSIWDRSIYFGDVTGDGLADVVSGSPNVDVGGVVDVGALFVWSGGPGLAGSPPPVARLAVPGAEAFDRLGQLGRFADSPGTQSGIVLADLTGDGILDILSAAMNVRNHRVGTVYLWSGGVALAGSPAPAATLELPAAPIDRQFLSDSAIGILMADVTGDGSRDVVAGALFGEENDRGTSFRQRGAVYVFAGDAGWSGAPPPLATLVGYDGNTRLDHLAYSGFDLADVTGDGVRDVIIGSSNAPVGGVDQAGAIFGWQGGPWLAGSPAPTVTLRASNPSPLNRIGDRPFSLIDLSGDGVLDVACASAFLTVQGMELAGGLAIFGGGPGLAGDVEPLLTLKRRRAFARDFLTSLGGPAIYFVDFSGDGRPDLVTGSPNADAGGAIDTGVLIIERTPIDGPTRPDIELVPPGAPAGFRMGS